MKQMFHCIVPLRIAHLVPLIRCTECKPGFSLQTTLQFISSPYSVLKHDAGKLAELNKFGVAVLLQAKRTATGIFTLSD